ncbi:hypothetical protein [Deinococcus yavapaiensis]|uniref:Uncharacterized protein n=1 Tax=Deinococcus yavapaiensis KR-236 TaxID=694435 RepID=A0A318SK63_9DEIO|nr:hypothetical protein [Deinococcus yavapaiensis]PYE54749.1 hypothetical protein DES52_10419 [Deinococcus yavapaiensis KR-236]
MTQPIELSPRFPDAAPFLGRFLPRAKAAFWGLSASFCDLHAFLRHLFDTQWYGYLHATLDGQDAFVLIFEGRAVAAASGQNTADAALADLLNLFLAGAPLGAYVLERDIAHALSGVGSRAWKFNLTEDFTGLHVDATGASFYVSGAVLARLPVRLPYEGAFPAPLRPNTLILPKSLAGWAHQNYVLTLRGKDSLNPITTIHQQFRQQFGHGATAVLRAIAEGLTPAEYSLRSDAALHELEAVMSELVKGGFVRARS